MFLLLKRWPNLPAKQNKIDDVISDRPKGHPYASDFN